jgi:hypothetical protein
MTYRERALRIWLALVMVMTVAVPAMNPAPAVAADGFFTGGPIAGSAPTVVPNDHTPLAVRFSGSGLEANSSYYVKVRLTLTPDPATGGGGANHRGFIWNGETDQWVRNRGAAWTDYPTVQTDGSGNVVSANDANWMFFKFGNENSWNQAGGGQYYLNISLNKGGIDGGTLNSSDPLLVKSST